MKKRVKKLGLHRETLRNLQNEPLRKAVGGTNKGIGDQETLGGSESQGAACTVVPFSVCYGSCSC